MGSLFMMYQVITLLISAACFAALAVRVRRGAGSAVAGTVVGLIIGTALVYWADSQIKKHCTEADSITRLRVCHGYSWYG